MKFIIAAIFVFFSAPAWSQAIRPMAPTYTPIRVTPIVYRPVHVRSNPRPAYKPITQRPYTYAGSGWNNYSMWIIYFAAINAGNAANRPAHGELGEIPCADLIKRVKEDGKISREEGAVLNEWRNKTGRRLERCR